MDENGRLRYLHAPLDSDNWLAEYNHRWVGAIVEVKGSDNVRVEDIHRAFTRGRIRVSLNRIGLTPRVEEALHDLDNSDRFDYGEGVILNIVFSQMRIEGPWMNIILDEADEFIVNRMSSAQNYLAKSGSRYFFPSELIQYMIWSANRRNR